MWWRNDLRRQMVWFATWKQGLINFTIKSCLSIQRLVDTSIDIRVCHTYYKFCCELDVYRQPWNVVKLGNLQVISRRNLCNSAQEDNVVSGSTASHERYSDIDTALISIIKSCQHLSTSLLFPSKKTRKPNSLQCELHVVHLYRLLLVLDAIPVFFYFELLTRSLYYYSCI